MKITCVVMAGGVPRLSETCIESLRNIHAGENPSIYVADGSKGCAIPRNDGVKNGTEADVYLTLDSDVIFTRPVLQKIRSRFESDPHLGVLGARLYHANGTIQHAGAWVHNRQAGHYGQGMTDETYPLSGSPYYCEYVCGAVFAFRKETWDEVGGFDESQAFGPEDQYFCLKAWEKGWKVLYDPEVTAVHIAGGVRGQNSYHSNRLEYERLQVRNFEGIEHFQQNYWKWDFNPIFQKVHAENTQLYPQTKNLVTVCRWDARGDCLVVSAAIRKLKTDYPEKQVRVITSNPDVFEGNPDISSVADRITSPLGLKVELNTAIERKPTGNMYDVFCRELTGDIPNKGIKPILHSGRIDTDQFIQKMRLTFGSVYPKKMASIHCARTHWKSKDLPGIFWQKVAHGLAENGFHVLAIGSDQDFLPVHQFVSDFRSASVGVLKEIIQASDMFIGVDSFPMHVCLTTDTPGVVMFTGTSPEGVLPPGQNQITPIKSQVSCVGCKNKQTAPIYHLECPQNQEYACRDSFDAGEVVKTALSVLSFPHGPR